MARQAQSFKALNKRVATNAVQAENTSLVKYHNTIVYQREDDKLTLRHNGFTTKTTKDRINTALMLDCIPCHITQEKFQWYIVTPLQRIPFTENFMTLSIAALQQEKVSKVSTLTAKD
jgi:hypothetical protein